MTLQIVAVSPPHWARSPKDQQVSLDSSTPFSLLNALRGAVTAARRGTGSLSFSNFSGNGDLSEFIVLHKFFREDHVKFSELILKQDPNVILMSVMALSLPGAIEYAKIVKNHNENTLIVIGGKHPTETVFLENGSLNNNSYSISELIINREIPDVFDIILSGDGEEFLEDLLESYGDHLKVEGRLCDYIISEDDLNLAGGDWLAVQIKDAQIIAQLQSKISLNREYIYPQDFYNTKSKFLVLPGRKTEHLYSYNGRGCAMNCFFCSERRDINGRLNISLETAAELAMQMLRLPRGVSSFVEDSIFLGGSSNLWAHFCDTIESSGGNSNPFGCQLTADIILSKKFTDQLSRLKESGLYYVFFGLETADPEIAKSMSKNRGGLAWLEKGKRAIELLANNGIKVGVSVLFGLGESQETRLRQLRELQEWNSRFSEPRVVSLNIATQHPLRLNGNMLKYTEWGTPEESDRFDLYVNLFGEASERYSLDGVDLISVGDLLEIESYFNNLKFLEQ